MTSYYLQIIQTESSLLLNSWYKLDLLGLNQGSLGFSILLNNQSVSVQSDSFEGINFEVLNGPLYVGGHPNPLALQVSERRRGNVHNYTFITCHISSYTVCIVCVHVAKFMLTKNNFSNGNVTVM